MPILTLARDVPVQPSLADQIAAKRWQHQVKGIIWNGLFVDTSTDSYNLIMGASYGVTQGFRADNAQWKFGDPITGESIFSPTSNAEMTEIGKLVYDYVQACFDHESELYTAAKVAGFDPAEINVGWP